MKKTNCYIVPRHIALLCKWKELIGKIKRALKIAFGILPNSVYEAREMFENSGPSYGTEWRYGIRVKVVKFTPYWEAIFQKWVDLCDSESQVKGAFFSGLPFGFCDSEGKHRDNPLATCAAKKWLTYLTDALDSYDQDMVWKIAARSHWCSGSETARLHGVDRCHEFAPVMAENAKTYMDLNTAYSYAKKGSPEQAAILARMTHARKYHTMQGA